MILLGFPISSPYSPMIPSLACCLWEPPHLAIADRLFPPHPQQCLQLSNLCVGRPWMQFTLQSYLSDQAEARCLLSSRFCLASSPALFCFPYNPGSFSWKLSPLVNHLQKNFYSILLGNLALILFHNWWELICWLEH